MPRRPLLYLLSHAHTDHLIGLERFSGVTIYCSAVTKDLVLRLSKVGDRMRRNVEGSVAVDKNIRTYQNLCAAPSGQQKGGAVDLLEALPLNMPTVVTLDTAAKDECRLTLIDANHCPGSVMFLIQMRGKNVLYTGDIRAEPWWVDNLCKMPLLAPFLGCLSGPSPSASGEACESFEYTPLDNIYLDTASFMCRATMTPKVRSVEPRINGF